MAAGAAAGAPRPGGAVSSDRPGGSPGVVDLDLDAPPGGLGPGGRARVLVVASLAGLPVGTAFLQAPPAGAGAGAALAEAARAALSGAVRVHEVERRVRDRTGGWWWTGLPAPPVTVAVCSRGDAAALRRCLAAVAALDARVAEVLVVAAAPGPGVREAAAGAGAALVETAVPGDAALRDAALRRCATDLLALVEEDRVPGPGWLAGLARHFFDPLTAATTGPELPARLGSDAEAAAWRALTAAPEARPRRLDPHRSAPLAVTTQADGNLVVRTGPLRDLGGWSLTPDGTGPPGDRDAMARLIAAGMRVVVDPGQSVRRDPPGDAAGAAARARARGLGAGAAVARMAGADGEALGVRGGIWPLTGARRGDLARETARGWAEGLRAGAGPRGPRAAVSTPRAGAMPPAQGAPAPRPRRTAAAGRPDVTVVVPTVGTRSASLERVMEALSAQTLARDRYEVVLVPNGPGAAGLTSHPLADRVVARDEGSLSGARNAGAEAAAADLVVYCDDDVVPEAGGLEAYLDAHRRSPGVLLGPYYPATVGETYVQQWVGHWWCDHFTRKYRPGHRTTFSDLAGGWIGMPRSLILGVGGFDEGFDHRARREDWEFSCRCRDAGAPFVPVPGAVAWHHYAMDTGKFLRDKVGEGYGDVLLTGRRPEVLREFWIAHLAAPGRVGGAAWRAALATGRAVTGPGRPAAERTLAVLERRGARRRWRRTL
ncbi:MAG: glycosyltransferase, partial [Thermoleophilia bacterium]